MKLATLKDGTRDGQLVVVSQDLSTYLPANSVAGTMRAALDDWDRLEPQLQAISDQLTRATDSGDAFDATGCMAPLPRASQWADGSAYVNHVELVRKARGAEIPDSFWVDPLMYMGAPDAMLGPHDDIAVANEDWGIDMEAEVGVVVDDLPQGISPDEAAAKTKLIMILNDISYRNLIAAELGKGFGFFQSKGPTAFSPVAVTPDELGAAWHDGMVHRQMLVSYNGEPFGRADAGVDMTFNFPRLVSHAARTRDVQAGAIIGSGTISNKDVDGTPGKPIAEGGKGYSCIAELRMIETIADGAPKTEFMKFGDAVRIDMQDDDGNSIFGAIDQTVVRDS
jgi:fumarylacetoacetate (FAA) hydrolase